MFDNIGRKIKNLAELVTWLGIIGSVLVGFVVCCIDEHMILPGFMIMILGGLASWLSSFFLYAYGQQVESTENIEKMLKKLPGPILIGDLPDPEGQAERQWRCSGCGKMISTEVCPYCKTKTASKNTKTDSCDQKKNTVFCPKCNFEQPAAAKFCCRCGAEIKKD